MPQPSSRSGAWRDLAVISLALAVVLWLGAATGAITAVRSWIGERSNGHAGEVMAVGALVLLAMLAYAILRWRSAAKVARTRGAAETRFQHLVERMPSVTYTWDPRGGNAGSWYVSPQVRTVLGIPPEMWVADPTRRIERVHAEDRDRVLETLQRGVSRGEPVTVEYRFVRGDGDVLWIREDAMTIERDPEGRPSLVQGVLLDVTERRRAEQQLAETEGRYRTLVERVPAVTYVWDTTYSTGEAPAAYISPQVRQLLGYGPEAFDDPTLWRQLVHPDDVERVLAEWAACERGDVAFRSEYRMRSNDGRVVWVRDEAVPISRDDAGHVIFQGVMFDITERKAAEERLLAAETRYRSLVEHMPVVAYLVDDVSDPPERYVAPGVTELTGYTQGEWISDPHLWAAILHPDDRRRVLDAWEVSTREGTPFRGEYRMIARDGRTVWVLDDARAVERDDARGSLVWQGVLVDVTARVEAEQRVREAELTYRTLVEQLPVVVYQDAIDDASTALYISPQYERVFGYTVEERLADPWFWVDRLHPDDRERVTAESARTNETGDPFVSEYRLAPPRRHVSCGCATKPSCCATRTGRRRMWQGVLIDIDERRRAEDRLSKRDAILDAVAFAAERFLRSHGSARGAPGRPRAARDRGRRESRVRVQQRPRRG